MNKQVRCITFSGHRPQELWGFRHYEEYEHGRCKGDNPYALLVVKFASMLRAAVKHNGTRTVFTGGALGVDSLAFDAAISVPGLRVIIVLPSRYHGENWPARTKQSQAQRLAKAHQVLCVPEALGLPDTGQDLSRNFELRNRYMLDNSDGLIAVRRPAKLTGGTVNAINYAQSRGIPIRLIDPAGIASV